MTGHRPFSELTRDFSPERKARTVAKVRALKEEMPLAELRQARELSQKELARALKVGQPAVAARPANQPAADQRVHAATVEADLPRAAGQPAVFEQQG